MLQKLNPFRSLPNPKEVWAWGMYDLANQSFTLLIITMLYPAFFREHVVGDDSRGTSLWSNIVSASLLIVVLIGPAIGAFADAHGLKKRILMTTGVLCALVTAMLALPSQGQIALAAALFIVGNVCYQLSENFLASFLPEVASSRNIGKVSAIGWSMGYLGALILLVVVSAWITIAKLPGDGLQPIFIFAAVWYAAGMLAPAIVLKEVKPKRKPESNAFVTAWKRLADTARQAGRYRQLFRFLFAFFIYGMGVQTVVNFAGIMLRDFDFTLTQMALFMLQITVTAGIGAVITIRMQRTLGCRTTLYIYLAVWIVTCLGLLGLSIAPPDERPQWLFWTIGNGVGFGLGGIGAASRAMVGRFTPQHKTAEFFGLWGMTYKLAGVAGVFVFGQAKAFISDPIAYAILLLFFILGALALARVSEVGGIRACQQAAREADPTA